MVSFSWSNSDSKQSKWAGERQRERERDRGINQVVVVLRDELAGHWEMSTAAPTGTSDACLLFVRYYTEIGKEYVNLP